MTMTTTKYSDRALACAHLRKILGDTDTASLVRPDAHEFVWSAIKDKVSSFPSVRVVSATKNLADHCNTTAAHDLAHYEGIDTDDGLDKWRAWVERECAAELAAIVGDESAPTSKGASEMHITPALTLAEFFRVALALRGSCGRVSVEVFNDGTVKIDGTTRIDGDVNDALVACYRANVAELRRRADSARIEAAALDEVIAKAVTP